MLNQRVKKRDRKELKRGMVLFTFLALLGVGLFIGCNSSTTNPSAPFAGSVPKTPTATPTGTVFTNTPTNSPTLPTGANTFTPTPTYSLPVPSFKGNYSTSTDPRCMVLSGSILTVGEHEVTVGGSISEMEEYTISGSTLTLNNISNAVLSGSPPIATPGTPVAFSPATIALAGVQGFVNPGGNSSGAWTAVLDLNSGGGATLYTGYYSSWTTVGIAPALQPIYLPFFGTGYGSIPMNNPQGLTADVTNGVLYVADTGLGYVEEYSPFETIPGVSAIPLHRWNGSPGVTQGGPPTNTIFKSAAVSFKSPYAVTCDNAGNVWVADNGYPNSYISEYTSGATTILQSWQGTTGCSAQGIAVDSATNNVYIADAGNHMVEVYNQTGTLLTAFGDPGPAAHEFYPFSPTCIAFSGGVIFVGDVANDFIDVFQ